MFDDDHLPNARYHWRDMRLKPRRIFNRRPGQSFAAYDAICPPVEQQPVREQTLMDDGKSAVVMITFPVRLAQSSQHMIAGRSLDSRIQQVRLRSRRIVMNGVGLDIPSVALPQVQRRKEPLHIFGKCLNLRRLLDLSDFGSSHTHMRAPLNEATCDGRVALRSVPIPLRTILNALYKRAQRKLVVKYVARVPSGSAIPATYRPCGACDAIAFICQNQLRRGNCLARAVMASAIRSSGLRCR